MSGKRPFRWARWALAAALALLIVSCAARLWLLEGWLRTVRIDGASMAPNLRGRHLDVTCSDCGIAFRCDGEYLPGGGRLVCPNCGYRDLETSSLVSQGGDTVYVDRWPLLAGGPRRGDVVAFEDPLAGGLSVKRVAGLPGETLSIRGGDLYADGQLVRKTLPELRQVALLVHDNDYLPRSLAGSDGSDFLRWKPSGPASGWQLAGSGYRYQPPKEAPVRERAWLEYVHWRCDASLTPRAAPSAILDNDPYNQGESRRLNVVSDVLLACDVQFSDSGRLTLAMLGANGLLQVELDVATGAITASRDRRKLATIAAPMQLAGRRVPFEFAHCDAQLLLAIDGRPVLRARFPRTQDPSAVARLAPALRIGCTGGSFKASRLQVWRDLYLLEPRGTDRPWKMDRPLATREFLLLGDNVPVSIDSRHWTGVGLERDRLRGVVRPRRHQQKGP